MTLSSELEWDVRTTGNNTNGGAFNRRASGTDYSQQDSAQLSLTDCATSGVGSTTLTSATGGFTAAMVGNTINLSNGTNLTTGFYEIMTYVDANTVTIDRAPDDGVGGLSGVTGKVGGALAWPPGSGPVPRNKVWIKHGTYYLTSTVQSDPGGPVYIQSYGVHIEGYELNHGDMGSKPLFLADPSATYTSNIFHSDSRLGPTSVANIKVDCQNNSSNVYGIGLTDYRTTGRHLEVINCYNGIVGNNSYVYFSKVINAQNTGFGSCHTVFCYARDCPTAFNIYINSATHCVAANCSTGFYFNGHAIAYRCIADNCSNIAFHLYTNYSKSIECLATNSNIGWFNQYGNDTFADACFAYNCNTVRTGYVNSPNYDYLYENIDSTSITSDPYTDSANGDYTINNNETGGRPYRQLLENGESIAKTFYPNSLPEKQDLYVRDYNPFPLYELSVGIDPSRDYSSLTECFAALDNTLIDQPNSRLIITVYNDTATDKWICDTSLLTLSIPTNCADFTLTVDDDSWHKGQYNKGCIVQLQSQTSSSVGCFQFSGTYSGRVLIERLAFDANNKFYNNAYNSAVFHCGSNVTTIAEPTYPNRVKNLYIRGGDGTTVDSARSMSGLRLSGARHWFVDSCIVENLVCTGSQGSYSSYGIYNGTRGLTKNCVVNNVSFASSTQTNYGIFGATGTGSTENCIVTNIATPPAGSSECYNSSISNMSNCFADDLTGTSQTTASVEFVDHANSDYRLKPGASAVGSGPTTKAQIEDITGNRRRSVVAHDAGAFNNISGYDYDYDVAVPTADPTGLTTVFPFRYLVEDDFDDGTGPVAHPLRGN